MEKITSLAKKDTGLSSKTELSTGEEIKSREKLKLDYYKAGFIGLGFFAITLTWTLYNSFVPIFLKRFMVGEGLIGLIMALDNIAAISLQPYFGILSDNTNSRFGHRLPFIMIGAPVAAVFFSLIPLAVNLTMLLTFLIIMNLSMSIFRAPTVALMPDLTPAPLRSKANGVINLMGGIGAVITYGLGSQLYDLNPLYPFILAAILLLVVVFLFIQRLQEPAKITTQERERINIVKIVKDIFAARDKSLLYLLMAIFFWFFGYSAVEAFFTLYGTEFLGIKESTAALSLTFFSGSFMLMAIPSGFIASSWGRKKTILIGITILIIIFSLLFFSRDLIMIWVLLGLGGIGWAFININSYPMVVGRVEDKIGSFTGIYYFFSTIPAILSPPVLGKLIEMIDYRILFPGSIFSFILALILMLLVKEEKNSGGKA